MNSKNIQAFKKRGNNKHTNEEVNSKFATPCSSFLNSKQFIFDIHKNFSCDSIQLLLKPMQLLKWLWYDSWSKLISFIKNQLICEIYLHKNFWSQVFNCDFLTSGFWMITWGAVLYEGLHGSWRDTLRSHWKSQDELYGVQGGVAWSS